MEITTVNPQQFIFDTPLYHWVNVNEEFIKSISSAFHRRFDGYNPDEKCESTYEVIQGFNCFDFNKCYIVDERIFVCLELKCTRKETPLVILLKNDWKNQRLCKVGQSPSIADMHIAQVRQYDKVIEKNDLKDFTRAIGLAANGIGIGSFVYLRRIFERLIAEIASQQIALGVFSKEDFNRLRMNEKIDLLKETLPEFIVEQKNIYGIISKGIHELSEQECLDMFDAMRFSIEMILDAKLDNYLRNEKIKQAKATISKFANKLANA